MEGFTMLEYGPIAPDTAETLGYPTTYVDSSGSDVQDAGSGSALASIFSSLSKMGTGIAAIAMGPQNSGYAYHPYGYNQQTGLPLTAPVSSNSGLMTVVFLAIAALVALFVFKKL
jgi:hypothetical protein